MTKYRIAEIQLTGKFRVEYWVPEKKRFFRPCIPGFWSASFWPFQNLEFSSLQEAKNAIARREDRDRLEALPNIIHPYP